jgi:hypothetical protein
VFSGRTRFLCIPIGTFVWYLIHFLTFGVYLLGCICEQGHCALYFYVFVFNYYLTFSWRILSELHEIRKRKANWIGYIFRRNCLLQRVIEGKIERGIEVTERLGRRRQKLLEDLKERRGYSHLKEEALNRTMWRARFGRGFGPVVRQTTKWMNIGWRQLQFLVSCFICTPGYWIFTDEFNKSLLCLTAKHVVN